MFFVLIKISVIFFKIYLLKSQTYRDREKQSQTEIQRDCAFVALFPQGPQKTLGWVIFYCFSQPTTSGPISVETSLGISNLIQWAGLPISHAKVITAPVLMQLPVNVPDDHTGELNGVLGCRLPPTQALAVITTCWKKWWWKMSFSMSPSLFLSVFQRNL